MIFGNWPIVYWRRIDCRAACNNDASRPFRKGSGGTQQIRRPLDIDRVCVAIGLLGGREGCKVDDDSRVYLGDGAMQPVSVEQVTLNFSARRGAFGDPEDLVAVVTQPRRERPAGKTPGA